MGNERVSAIGSWSMGLLLGLSVVVRVLVVSRLPDLGWIPSGESFSLYREALRHHFLEYLYYEHTEPLGMCLIHKVLLSAFGDAAFSNAVALLPSVINGVITTLLVYAIARRLGAHALIAWALSAVYSVALVPFEVWRYGRTLDHYTFVLVAWWLWALVNRVMDGRPRYDVHAMLAGALLVLIQKVAFLVVPVMVLATGCLLRGELRSRLRRTGISLVGPLVMIALVMGKNVWSSGLFATSSLGDANLAQFVHAAQGYNLDALYGYAKRAGAPPWYLWCFRRAEVIGIPSGPFLGACDASGSPATFSYDLKPLEDYLASHGETRLAQIVTADRHRLAAQPYLRSFFMAEMSPRFTVEYGKVSRRLFMALVWREPWTFLRQLARTHYMYLIDGSRFLSLLLREGLAIPYAGALSVATGLCFLIFMQGYLATYLLTARLLLTLRSSATSHDNGRLSPRGWWRTGQGWPTGTADGGLVVLILGVVMTSGVFTLACCENGRYFLQITPYLVPLLACFLHRVLLQPATALASAPGGVDG